MARGLIKTDAGFKVSIRLIPGARKSEIVGIEKNADEKLYLKVKVSAVPEKGKANKALENLMAKCLGLPKSSFEVISGHTSRVKTVLVAGEPKEVQAKLQTFLGGD